MLTFPQLYSTLTLHSLLKLPKLGKCKAQEDEVPLLDFAASKNVFKSRTSDTYKQPIAELQTKMDELAMPDKWKCENILPADDSMPEVVDCIVYYVTGFLSRKIRQMFSCTVFRDPLSARRNRASEVALTNSNTKWPRAP